jgi:hypothetical protein
MTDGIKYGQSEIIEVIMMIIIMTQSPLLARSLHLIMAALFQLSGTLPNNLNTTIPTHLRLLFRPLTLFALYNNLTLQSRNTVFCVST